MKFIVRFFPEIIIKSRPVRKLMVRQLKGNLKKICQNIDPNCTITGGWDVFFIESKAEEAVLDRLREALQCTPGINHFNQVAEYPLGDFEDAYQKTLALYQQQIEGKSFCVRVKRIGKHDFTSIDMERYIGGGLNQAVDTACVKLKHPDVLIRIEVKDDTLFIVERRFEGMGGYPLGSQETVMTLVSGGFDSSVACHQMLSRGVRTHYLFFNLGGRAHEIGVKQISRYIWDKYGSSHDALFITVPFEGVVQEILQKVPNTYMGVVLKRMFYRAAERVANRFSIDALVTGEAIAQVSSQTIPNLKIIEEVSDKLFIRPLIVTDKQRIIDQARAIGVEQFCESIPEFCGVISDKPTTHAKKDKLLVAEGEFDLAVLEAAVEAAIVQNIRDVGVAGQDDLPQVDELSTIETEQTIVVDIRHPDEIEAKPLDVQAKVIAIPFYSLRNKFIDLDQSQNYALYCDKGVMSKLQAMYLKEEGFENVSIYKKL